MENLHRNRLYEIQGVDSSGFIFSQPTDASATTLNVIGALEADPASTGEIDLYWNVNATDVTEIDVYRSSDNVSFAQIASLPPGTYTYPDTDPALQDGTTYYYEVQAMETGGPSQMVTASAATLPAIGDAAASGVSTDEIDLSWTSNVTDATSITVERSSDGINFTPIQTLSGDATGYNDADTSLLENTQYWYRVQAMLPGGEASSYSNVASDTTFPAISNLTAAAVSAQEIDLTWNLNTTTATAIEVDRSTDGVNFTPLTTTLSPSATGYPDTDAALTENTTYYYQVRAIEPSGPTSFASAQGVTMCAVSNPSAMVVGSDEISVNWQLNVSDATSIEVDRSTDGVNYTTLSTTVAADASSFDDTDAPTGSGQTYWYRVQAIRPSGPSQYAFAQSTEPVESPGLVSAISLWVSPNATIYGTYLSSTNPGSLSGLMGEISTIRASAPTESIVVNFESGYYFTDTTIDLDYSYVTFQKAPGADPIIGSGVRIGLAGGSADAWSVASTSDLEAAGIPAPSQSADYTIYEAPIPEALSNLSGEAVQDLYVGQSQNDLANNLPATRTQYPAAGSEYPTLSWNITYQDKVPVHVDAEFPLAEMPEIENDAALATNDGQYLELDVMEHYTIARLEFQYGNVKVSGANCFVTPPPTEEGELLTDLYGATALRSHFFISNVPQNMTSIGEWYEELATTALPDGAFFYIGPPATGSSLPVNNQTFDVALPVALPVTDANDPSLPGLALPGHSASEGAPLLLVRDATSDVISGITFQFASWLATMAEPLGGAGGPQGYVGIQEGMYTTALNGPGPDEVPPGYFSTQVAAVTIYNSTNSSISDCVFNDLGGAGVSLFYGSSDNTILNSQFSYIGGNGIIVDGEEGGSTTDPVLDAGAASYMDEISENTLSFVGQNFPDSTGIQAGICDQLTISDNTLFDLPADAISDGRQHNYAARYPIEEGGEDWSTCTVVDNVINNVATKMYDGGAIYIDGTNWNSAANLGTVIAGNEISDVGAEDRDENFGPAPAGIYFDSNTTGATLGPDVVDGISYGNNTEEDVPQHIINNAANGASVRVYTYGSMRRAGVDANVIIRPTQL